MSNFLIGLVLLVGVRFVARSCFPRCCTSEWRDARSNKLVVASSSDRTNGFVGCSLEDDGDNGFGMYLQPGHMVKAPNGSYGTVLYVLDPKEETEQEAEFANVVIRFDDGFRLGFRYKDFEDIEELRGVAYMETFRSVFLSKFKIKLLTVAFQLSGIASSAYSCTRLLLAVPVHSWLDWQLFGFLLSQHGLVMTLMVAVGQTLTIATNVATSNEKCLGWTLFALSGVVALPLVLVLMTTGLYGILIFIIPGILLGLPFLGLVAVAVSYMDHLVIPSEVKFPGLGGKTAFEISEEFASKARLGKAWFLVTAYLPALATFHKTQLFLRVSYLVVMTPALPLWWLILSGFSGGWQVAVAFLLEISLPLVVLILFSALTLALGNQYNFSRSGMVLVLGFVLSAFP